MKKKIFILMFTFVFALPLGFYASGCGNKQEELIELVKPKLVGGTEINNKIHYTYSEDFEVQLTFDGVSDVNDYLKYFNVVKPSSNNASSLEYKVIVSIKDRTKYKWSDGTNSVKLGYYIDKAPLSLTEEDFDGVEFVVDYGPNMKLSDVTIDDVDADEELKEELSNFTIVWEEPSTPLQVGRFEDIDVTFVLDDNHESLKISTTVVVIQEKVGLGISNVAWDIDHVTYDASTKSNVVSFDKTDSSVDVGVTYTTYYKEAIEDTYAVAVDTSKAGYYKTVASLDAGDGYYVYDVADETTRIETLEKEWTIEKAEVAVPTLASETSFDYDATEKHLTFDGLTEIAELVTTSGTSAATNAGNYTFTILLADTTNYVFANGQTSITINWRIENVDYTVTITGDATVTMGGNQVANGDTVHFGDEIIVSYTLTDGYVLDTFTVNGETVANGSTIQVTGPVAVVFAQRVPTEAELSQFTFAVTDSTNHTASVGAANTSISGEITLPKYVDIGGITYSVTSVAENGFASCASLTNVIVPNFITSIGAGAFRGCSSLAELTIPFVGASINVQPGPTSLFGYIFGITTYGSGTTQLYNANVEIVDGDAQITPTGIETFAIPSSLKKVNVTGGVMLFAAFSNCTNLEEINVLGTVPSEYFTPWSAGEIGTVNSQLGIGTFYGCSNLETLTLCEGITGIEFGTCYDCANLESVTLPSTLTKIGYAAFNRCEKLDNITIPANVQIIDDFAFYGNSSLTSLTFAQNSSVNTIGEWAFGEANLTNITLPASVRTLRDGAFAWNFELASVTLNSGLQTIEGDAFGRSAITSIHIPASVTTIAWDAFYGCSNLASIVVDENNAKYTSRNNSGVECNCIIDKTTKTLVLGCQNATIPTDGSVIHIGDYAFAGASLSGTLVIPEGIESIGAYAFTNCTEITSVTIPASVTSIGSYAFGSKYALEGSDDYQALINAGALTQLGSDNKTYAALTKLTTVTFANGSQLTSLPECLFHMQMALTTVNNLPNTIETIEHEAFGWCKSLASITLPTGLKTIGWAAFQYCAFTSITLPEGLETIADVAFQMCTNLTSINIPASVNTIGTGENGASYPYCVFTNCTSLNNVTFANPNGWVVTTYDGASTALSAANLANTSTAATYLRSTHRAKLWTRNDENFLTFIPDNAVNPTNYTVTKKADVTVAGSLVIPNSYNSLPVTSIGNSAFSGCSGITSVTIPASVTIIGDFAFYQCSNLVDAELPANLTTIGQGAFRETAISAVTIPATVISIGSEAFEACNNLTSVSFAEGSTLDLPSSIFIRCPALTTVTLASTMDQFSNKAFNQSNALTTIIWNNKLTLYAPAGFDAVFNGQSAGSVFIEEGYDLTILTQLNVDVSDMGVFTLAQIIQAYNLFTPYLYSETAPKTEGNFWHYVNDVPTVWA